jgi:DNA-binding NarL/FixJ family response regulator
MTDAPTRPASTTRVLLVDDHDLIRDGLTMVFSAEPTMEVVGAAKTVAEGLRMYADLSPDVIVTDLQLQDGTGLDVVRAVRRERGQDGRETGIVVLTMHAGDDQIFAAMEAGASAFVGKDAPSTEVVQAARHAAVSPRSFLCAGLASAMMRRAGSESTRLTGREHDVLVLLADGLSAAEIGGRLHLSESTVKSHVAHVYQKLGAANRAQALVRAMRIGLLSSVSDTTSTTNVGKK